MILLKRKISSLLSTVFIFCLFSLNSLAKSPLTMNGQSLTTAQAAGQLMMIGIQGRSLEVSNRKTLSSIPAGSIILFKRNIGSQKELTKFTDALQKTQKKELPFIIGIDQEGGDVVRLQTQPPLPSAFSISESKSIPFISVFSDRLSELLWSTGINMNFAPVLDLANPSEKSFLGSRSFGMDPAWVSKIGFAFSRQHILNYVVPVAKHFPGIGTATIDPHSDAGVIKKAISDLESNDIQPFKQFTKLGRFSGMMLSHFIYQNMDPELPASLSPKVISYLRNQLHFQGLIMTDDLQMDAVKTNSSIEDAAVKSLKSGVDIVMVAYSRKSQQKVFDRIRTAIEKEEITHEEVQSKLNRIGFVKTLISRGLSQKEVILNLTLKDFYDLDEQLLDLKLQKQKRKISSIDDSQICLFSNHKSFNKSFLQATRSNVKDLSNKISKINKEVLEELSQCPRTVLTVFNERSQQLVQQLPEQVLKSAYIVNLGLPSLTRDLSQYAVIQLDFPHQLAGRKIAQLIH